MVVRLSFQFLEVGQTVGLAEAHPLGGPERLAVQTWHREAKEESFRKELIGHCAIFGEFTPRPPDSANVPSATPASHLGRGRPGNET